MTYVLKSLIILSFFLFSTKTTNACTINSVPDDVLKIAFGYVNLEDHDSLRVVQKRFSEQKFSDVLPCRRQDFKHLVKKNSLDSRQVMVYLQRFEYAEAKYLRILNQGTDVLLSDRSADEKMEWARHCLPFALALLPESNASQDILNIYIAIAEDLAAKGSRSAMEFLTTVKSPNHLLLIANKYMGTPLTDNEEEDEINDEKRAGEIYLQAIDVLKENYTQLDFDFLSAALKHCNQLKMYGAAAKFFSCIIEDETTMLYNEDVEQGVIANLNIEEYAEAQTWVDHLIQHHAGIQDLGLYNFRSLAGKGLQRHRQSISLDYARDELEKAEKAFAPIAAVADPEDQMKYLQVLVALRRYDEAVKLSYTLLSLPFYTGDYLVAAGLAMFKMGQYTGNFTPLEWVVKKSDTVVLTGDQDAYIALYAAYTQDWELCKKYLGIVQIYAELDKPVHRLYLAYIYSLNPQWQHLVQDELGELIYDVAESNERIRFLEEVELPLQIFTTNNWVPSFFNRLREITRGPGYKGSAKKNLPADRHIQSMKEYIYKHKDNVIEGQKTFIAQTIKTCSSSFTIFYSEQAFDIIMNHGNLEALCDFFDKISHKGLAVYPWAMALEQKIQERLRLSCVLEESPLQVKKVRNSAIVKIIDNMKERPITYGSTIVARYGTVFEKLEAADLMFDQYKQEPKQRVQFLVSASLLYSSALEEIKRNQDLCTEALEVVYEQKRPVHLIDFPYVSTELNRYLHSVVKFCVQYYKSKDVVFDHRALKGNQEDELNEIVPNPLLEAESKNALILADLPVNELHEFENIIKSTLDVMSPAQLHRAAYATYTTDVHSSVPAEIWARFHKGKSVLEQNFRNEFVPWLKKALN